MKLRQKQIILALFSLVFLLGACTKDQRKLNKIEGTWRATSLVGEDGSKDKVKEYGLHLTYKFEQCNLKSDEFCPLTIESTYPGESTNTYSYGYRIVANGKWLEYGKNFENNTLFGYKILVLNNDELVLESDAVNTRRTISFVKN